MIVKINNKEYNFVVDGVWGAIYTYEEVCGDKLPFNPSKTLCLHILFWCILLRSNAEFDLSLEDFLKALDDVTLAGTMMSHYRTRMEILSSATAEVEASDAGGKKKD